MQSTENISSSFCAQDSPGNNGLYQFATLQGKWEGHRKLCLCVVSPYGRPAGNYSPRYRITSFNPYFRTLPPSLFSCLHFFNLQFWKWRSVALPAFAPAGLFHARKPASGASFLGLNFAKEGGKTWIALSRYPKPKAPNPSRYPGEGGVVKLDNRKSTNAFNDLPHPTAGGEGACTLYPAPCPTDTRSSSEPRSASRARCTRPRCRGDAECLLRPSSATGSRSATGSDRPIR